MDVTTATGKIGLVTGMQIFPMCIKYAYVPGYIFLNFGDHKISNKSSVWDSNHIKLGNVLAANASVKNVGQLQ